jgi:outer membrane lipoprotein-sorting protein
MRRRFFSILVVLSAFVATPAQAATTVAEVPVAGAKWQTVDAETRAATITEIERYLGGIPSMVAQFKQESADGSTGTGTFYMKRPGKMRWQYNPPAPMLLVSDGKVVTYYDASLDQVTYIGVDDTLAGFLAKGTIALESPTIQLSELEKTEGFLRATVVQRKKPDEGSLSLEFMTKPLTITRLVATDATGNVTTVRFENAQFGPVLDDALFRFEDPRGVKKRRMQQR